MKNCQVYDGLQRANFIRVIFGLVPYNIKDPKTAIVVICLYINKT